MVSALTLCVAGTGRANAVSVIDQQQPVIDASVAHIAVGGPSQQRLAQVVTTGRAGVLTEVRFPVVCQSGNLIVEVQGVTANVPNGVILASQSFPAASLPHSFSSPPSFTRLGFSTPASFGAGTQFAIVLRSTGVCGVQEGPVGDPYPGGDAYFDALPNPPGVWVPLGPDGGRFDLPFQTLVGVTVNVPTLGATALSILALLLGAAGFVAAWRRP